MVFIFNTVQANSVAHALRYAFDLPAAVGGSVLGTVVVLLAILRGLRGVARLMQWIVPFMALLWIACSLLIDAMAHHRPADDFSPPSFAAPSAGRRPPPARWATPSTQALTSSFQRGMFSNEAGMGSSP